MFRIALLFSLLSLSLLAHAQSETYNRVDFQVEAARQVTNDLLVVNLSADTQELRPSAVAEKLNTALNAALRQAAAYSTVKVSSGNQQTLPVYGKNNKIIAWHGHGEIHLESTDFKSAGELIMQLQATLQLGSVQFEIAPETRLQVENSLISEAIKAFQSRANAIQTAVGAKSYKIVHFAINSTQPVLPMSLMRSDAIGQSAIPAPEFAAGESRITAQITGTIELQ